MVLSLIDQNFSNTTVLLCKSEGATIIRLMTNYPMKFTAQAHSPSGLQTPWSTQTADRRSVSCSIPNEFGGPNSGFSPEDLFLLALMNCYIATLKVIAENSKMPFDAIDATGVLTLDKDESMPTPWMKQADLKFTVRGVQNEDRFRRLMERVSRQCMIINSAKTSVNFEFEVVAA